jgi:hypothetical protein
MAVPGTRNPVRFEPFEELFGRLGHGHKPEPAGLDAGMPCRHDNVHDRAEGERDPATLDDFKQIGRKESEIDNEKDAARQQRRRCRPAPSITHQLIDQSRRQQHGGRDGGAIRAGEAVRPAVTDRQGDREQHHRPVHEGNVDVPVFFVRGLADPQAGKPAELHRLARQRERAGNDCLTGDDGRNRCEQHELENRPARGKFEEGIAAEDRMLEEQRRLAGMVQK